MDAILQRRFIKKEDWSCADLTSDEEELCLAKMNHFDSQVHRLIFIKMMMEEIPRKPSTYPEFVTKRLPEPAILERPLKLVPT